MLPRRTFSWAAPAAAAWTTAALQPASSTSILCGRPFVGLLHCSRSMGSTAASQHSGDALAWLASLVNYEATGMPRQVASPSTASGSSADAATAGAPAAAPAAEPAAAAGDAPGRFDLSRMRALLAGLGDPQDLLPIVHIAGTKGKGSVAAMLAGILRAAGLKVGVYTSPHMHTIRERIQTSTTAAAHPLSGAATPQRLRLPDVVSEAAFEQLAARARDAAAAMPQPPSHFEAVTAMAFRHFVDAGADIAVIEAGMGGATDATNVAPAKKLQAAVITQIGWDHVDALGGTLESISQAKAGIMRPGRPVIIAAQTHAAAAAALADHARNLGCATVDAGRVVRVEAAGPLRVEKGPGWHLARQAVDVFEDVESAVEGSEHAPTPSRTAAAGERQPLRLRGVDVAMVGAHQRVNAATAVAAALQLRASGWPLTNEAIKEGLQAAVLPGRFQVLQLPAPPADPASGAAAAPQQGFRPPHIVLDGAHTPESAAALAAALREAFPKPAPLALVIAMANDKQHREVVAALRGAQPGVVVFTAVPVAGSTQRSAPPGTLAAHWQAAAMLSQGPPFRCRELIQAGITSALQRAQREVQGLAHQRAGGSAAGGMHPGVVCVTGSLHAVAAAARELEPLIGGAV